MTSNRGRHAQPEAVEPPRDGEFFFEEKRADKEFPGNNRRVTRSSPSVGELISAVVGRHPVVCVSLAVSAGVITTSLVMTL